MNRNIGFKERRYIEELRILTKSTAIDCIIDERFGRVIYIIKKGDMGLAIGKKGENIRRMQNVLGKRIEMVESADNEEEFIRNIFKPIQISRIFHEGEPGTIHVVLERKSDLAMSIGKGGCNVEKAKILMRRYHARDDIGITVEGETE